MNRLAKIRQQTPNWLIGAIFGLFTYGVQVMLHQLSNGLECDYAFDGLFVKGWLQAFLEMVGSHGLYMPFYTYLKITVGFEDIGHIPAMLIWSLCGAIFFRRWGLWRGGVVLLALQAIIIGVSSTLVFIGHTLACTMS